MPQALWLLIGLRFRAWLRRIGRSAATPRGALFLAAGLLFFALVFGPVVIARLLQGQPLPDPEKVESTRRVASVVLFASCLLTALFSSGEQGIVFTPAEVQFLFPGPFTRRQLLAYKLTSNALAALVYAVFLSFFLFPHSSQLVTLYLGVVLTLWFMQLFSTAVSLLLTTVGMRAFTLPRKALLVLVVTVAAGGLLLAGRGALANGPEGLLEGIVTNPVVRAVLTPTRWFAEAVTAVTLWPEFVSAAGRCLAVNAVLLAVVFLLDAEYLEASAATSERLAARLQRLRSGGSMAAAWAPARPRFTLPMLPWWGGAGPLAWRQLTTAVRSYRPLAIFLTILVLLTVGPRLARLEKVMAPEMTAWWLATILLGMTFAVLTPLLTFDFRGDIDRMDLLKSLPLSPYRLALGQLLAPTVLLSAVQLLTVAVIHLLWGGVGVLLVLVVVFALPFNFLSFGLENLLFLWFPARLTPAAPGDFTAMGRQTLLMMAKLAALLLVGLPPLLAGLVIYGAAWLLSHLGVVPEEAVEWVALTAAPAAAWLVLVVLCLGVVALVARAFRDFDVARDTPP